MKTQWVTTTISVLFLLVISTANAGQKNKAKVKLNKSENVEYLNAPGASELNLPFSDAVKVGKLLFLSGKIGNIPGSSKLADGGIQGQTRQAMENIKTSLVRYGLEMSNIVKCTIFMSNIQLWGDMNKVYVTFFPKHKPARSALGVNGLALGAAVEVECIASL